jgi:hypothetical protein
MIDLDLAEHNAFQNSQQEVFKFIKTIPDVQKEEVQVLIENLIKLGINLMKQQVYVQLMCEDD